MSPLELIAVLFGLACVWLTVRQNIWCWPTGLVQVALYIVVFYQAKLYSDVLLHVIYVVLQIYGWRHWLRGGKERDTLPVTTLSFASRLAWPLVSIAGAAAWGYFMASYTDAAAPYADAFVAVSSLIAQWLMTQKKLESWLFWIVVDIVAIGIYWQKHLWLTAGLYAVFLVLATLGLVAWWKSSAETSDAITSSDILATTLRQSQK